MPKLREQIALRLGARADQVVTTCGGMHALFLLAFVLCEPGDEVVMTTPQFPLGRNAFAAVGARARELPLSFDAGYRVDPAAMQDLLGPATRAVLLASPQNPTGVATPAPVLRDLLARIAKRAPHAYLIVDETYREAVYGEDAPAPSAFPLGERVVVTASLSKCHGSPGLRIGWAATSDAALLKQLTVAKFNTIISCGVLDEALALRALERQDGILASRRVRLARGLTQTAEWINAHRELVQWVMPDAGALCCVRLRPEAFDAAAVTRFYGAMQREGARVAPGDWFGDEARVFRLGFGFLEPDALERALAATGRALLAAVS
jgi:aspartate/methionine/tyrosine aminotransferase